MSSTVAAVAVGTVVSLLHLAGQHGVLSGLLNAGPYNLKLLRFERCPDEGTGEAYMDLKLTKKSTHKTFLTGMASVPYLYDDNVHAEWNFSRFGSRGWGLNAYHVQSPSFCKSLMKPLPNIFDFFFKSWGIKEPKCPIQPGNYTVELDTDLPQLRNMPSLPYGSYRFRHILTYGDPPIKIGCNEWYISCTERPRT